MNRLIAILWCTTFVPFAVLPWGTIAQPQPQPWYLSHLLFHIVYGPFVAVAIWAGWRLWNVGRPQAVRMIAGLVVVVQAVALAGHLGEAVSVVRNGGFDSGEDIFDERLHSIAANATVPALMAGMLLVIALTVVSEVHRRRQRRLPLGPSVGSPASPGA